MQRLRYAIFLLVFSLLTFPALAQNVTDPLGRQVSLDGAPDRVVSMVPGHTALVLALGAGDLLVAVDEWSQLPDGMEAERAGNAFSPNLEVIVGLEPDLVLADAYSGLAASLADFGIPVYAGYPETLDGVGSTAQDIGRLLHLEDRAAALVEEMEVAVSSARQAVIGLPVVTVYVEADSMLYAAGSDSWLGELIAAAGGTTITSGTFPQLNAEFILAADPDVIILLNSTWGESALTLAERPGWSGLTALRDGRVVEPDALQVDLLSQPGVHAGAVLELLLGWLHPEFSGD